MPLSKEGAHRLAEKMRREAEEDARKEKEKGGAKRSYLKFADGDSHIIRILPPKKGLEKFDPYRELDSHWGLGPQGRERVLCPRSYKVPQTCPICDELDLMFPKKKAGDEAATAFVDRFKLKHRFMYQVIVRGQEDLGPQLWEVSHETHTKMRGLFLDPDYGFALIEPGDEGFDIKVTREGLRTDTNYMVVPRRLPCPLAEEPEVASKWLDDMLDLDLYDRVEFDTDQMNGFLTGMLSPKEVKAAIFEARKDEATANANDDDDDDETPSGKQKM